MEDKKKNKNDEEKIPLVCAMSENISVAKEQVKYSEASDNMKGVV